MHDAYVGVDGLNTAESLKYLLATHLAQRELEEVTVHANLMKDASFCSWMRLMPMPPSLVGRHTTFHLIWFLFSFASPADRRKSLIKLSMRLDIDFERGRTKATLVADYSRLA